MRNAAADAGPRLPIDATRPSAPTIRILAVSGSLRDRSTNTAVLLCTPEYAGALPGSFKNALDWLIGDADPRSLSEKPVGWINASPRGAAVAAHESLRTVLGFAHATIVEAAVAAIAVTGALVGPDGTVTASEARARTAEVVAALARAAGA